MIEIRIYSELYLFVLFLLTQTSGGFGQDVAQPPRCNGAEYNDVCYWITSLPNDSSSPECPGGELGIVSDNTTWNYVTGKLAAQISNYASLKLGLASSPVVPVDTGTTFYDLYGRSLPGLKDQVESTNQCFIWDLSTLVIKGVNCGGLSFKYRALCSFGPTLHEKNCTGVGGVEINSKCFWISATTFGDVENSQLFCFENEGYLAPISDLQELNLILDSSLLIGTHNTKDISLGLTIYKNDWITLQGEIPQYLRFTSVVTTNIDERGCVYADRDWVWEVSRCNDRYKVVCQNKTDFWFEIDRYTFYDAHTLCASKGGKLAVPKSLQEHMAIQSIADTQGDRVWVGITRDPWYTYTGELVQWFNWKNIDDKELIDCVIVEDFRSPYPWTSRQCSDPQDYGLCSKNIFEGDSCIGAIYNNTTCYWMTSRDVTASQAGEQCRSYGGALAVLTSSLTNDFLTSSFPVATSSKVWIGITKQKKRWYSSIGQQTWFNWYKLGGSSPSNLESCVTFSAENNYQWSVGCPVVSVNDTLQPGNFCMKTLQSTITTETQTTEPAPQATTTDSSGTQDTAMPVTESTSQYSALGYWTETTAPPGSLSTSSSDKETDTVSDISSFTSPGITTLATTLTSSPTAAPETESTTTLSAAESTKSSLASVPTTSPRITTPAKTSLTSPPTTAPATEPITSSSQSPTTTLSAAESTKSSMTSVPTTSPRITTPHTTSLTSPPTTTPAAESTKSSLTSVPTMAPQVSSPTGPSTGSSTTTTGLKQSTQPLDQILSPLNKCGIKITYPSTGRFWNIPCLCSCNICEKGTNFRNISDAAVVEEMKSKIKKTLTVPKDKISALLNKKISKVDERASSTSIGLVSACVLVAILAFFLISDVIKIIYTVKNIWTTFR